MTIPKLEGGLGNLTSMHLDDEVSTNEATNEEETDILTEKRLAKAAIALGKSIRRKEQNRITEEIDSSIDPSELALLLIEGGAKKLKKLEDNSADVVPIRPVIGLDHDPAA
jgi:leucyl-tRNA synthetase